MDEETKAEVAALKRKLAQKQAELEKYRDDYAVLVTQETSIAQIIVVCENTDYLTDCLGDSVTSMETLAASDKVPGFEELFDFEDVSSYRSQMQIANGDYSDSLKEVCDTIDSLKEDLATNIQNTSLEITNLETAISIYGG